MVSAHTYENDVVDISHEWCSVIAPSGSRSSISVTSTLTEKNRAGAGRGIGQIYDALGERLERHANNYGRKRGWKGDWVRYRVANASEISRNAMAPNLVGPGRALDNLFTYAGRKLEERMNSMVEKMGFGPDAAHWKISEQIARNGASVTSGDSFKTSGGQCAFFSIQMMMKQSEFIDDCRRMLRYVEYVCHHPSFSLRFIHIHPMTASRSHY